MIYLLLRNNHFRLKSILNYCRKFKVRIITNFITYHSTLAERGGFYFEVKPFSSDEFAALFVPKVSILFLFDNLILVVQGWYHWLIGKSDWAVGFGSSRF